MWLYSSDNLVNTSYAVSGHSKRGSEMPEGEEVKREISSIF